MNKTTEKWRQTGLLEYLENETQCDELALSLEQMALLVFKMEFNDPKEKEQFASMVLPIVRRLYEINPVITANLILTEFTQFYNSKKQLLTESPYSNNADAEAEFVALYVDEVIKRKEAINKIINTPVILTFMQHTQSYATNIQSNIFSKFIGMTVEEANKRNTGWFVQPTKIDGNDVPISSSLCSTRVCVEVVNNIITSIESIGS